MTFKSQHFDSEFLASMWLIFYGLLPSHPLLFIFFNQDLFTLWRPPVVKDRTIRLTRVMYDYKGNASHQKMNTLLWLYDKQNKKCRYRQLVLRIVSFI